MIGITTKTSVFFVKFIFSFSSKKYGLTTSIFKNSLQPNPIPSLGKWSTLLNDNKISLKEINTINTYVKLSTNITASLLILIIVTNAF